MKSFVLRRSIAAFVALFLLASNVCAESRIEFTQEKLDNGLTVIYAPLHQAPVIHVRVAYHVGSKDERPDRQGFAHMFEHMMFRGSAHVKQEEHMQLIHLVGGISNAFTSNDQTTYVNTIPSNQLEMALYLEADRMSSFKVSEEIYRTERKVVGEEWGRRANNPAGTVWEDFAKLAYKSHSYRWTPIGDMDNLRAAPVEELQDFFNTYYVPNNATLIIAGDFETDAAKKLVRKYFGWMPRGADVVRNIPAEPAQTEERRLTVPKAVPLPMILIGYRAPDYKSDDQYGLGLLADIVGHGSSSRVHRKLVSGENPLCVGASTMHQALEDSGFIGFRATVMMGKNPDDVEKALFEIADEVVKSGVTDDELAKAKARAKQSWVSQRVTAESTATALTGDALFGGDPNRVNTELDKTMAYTAADIQKLAAKYLVRSSCDVLFVKPDAAGAMKAIAAQQPTAQTAVAPSTRPVNVRDVKFPDGYPQSAMVNRDVLKTQFQKGVGKNIDGVNVLVFSDPRMPTVSWSLTMRRGSHIEPDDKAGVGGITAAMLRRGSGDLSYAQFSEDLESRAIGLDASDSGDLTRISGACPTEQIEHAFNRTREMLRSPKFDAIEFEKLKQQSLNETRTREEEPGVVAGWELSTAMFGGSPLGRHSTAKTIKNISLDDVKRFYSRVYIPNDAILSISGDITVERAQQLAAKLLEGWPKAELPTARYDFPQPSNKLRIILVDRPEGRQSMIRMSSRAYDVHDDAKYAGRLASTILSGGIEGRLMRYVRAEKGYVYHCSGDFAAGRQAGTFQGGGETSFKTTADTIEAMFKVFKDMADKNVTDDELADAKLRVTGGMVMGMQTIQQQSSYRVEAILNEYPVDYFDKYAENVNAVTADQIRAVVNKYVQLDRFVVVVVAPAKEVQEQLQHLGTVEVLPMPAKREGGTDPTTRELMKPAAGGN